MFSPRLFALVVLALVFGATISRAQSMREYWDHFVRFEGYSLSRYKVHGRWHIGVGHQLARNDSVREISAEHARDLFTCDLAKAIQVSVRQIPSFDEHPVEVRMVIVDLAFNVGETGLRDFVRFRHYLDKHDYFGASKELAQSKRSQQVGRARTEWAIQCLTRAAVQVK